MAACCGLDTTFNEATETTSVIRRLFAVKNSELEATHKTHPSSRCVAIISGIVGAVNEITENTTTMLITLDITSTPSKYGILGMVTLGVGLPNAIFKGGISGDACEAGIALLKNASQLKQPKELLVATETLLFSLLLGESLRNLFLNLMAENSLPFELPQPLLHGLAILIALRGTGNALYCSHHFFAALTDSVLSGFKKGGHSIESGFAKVMNCRSRFFSPLPERQPLLSHATAGSSIKEKLEHSIQEHP